MQTSGSQAYSEAAGGRFSPAVAKLAGKKREELAEDSHSQASDRATPILRENSIGNAWLEPKDSCLYFGRTDGLPRRRFGASPDQSGQSALSPKLHLFGCSSSYLPSHLMTLIALGKCFVVIVW